VKQAWWRNVNKSSMGVLAARKKHVLATLADLAHADTLDIFNAKLAIFKSSDDYTRNAKLQAYLEQHWWNCIHMPGTGAGQQLAPAGSSSKGIGGVEEPHTQQLTGQHPHAVGQGARGQPLAHPP
jgi:hypothetical protein